MSSLYFWSCVVVLGLVTMYTRSFFATIGANLKISPTVLNLIRYAPTGALIAIVIPELIFEKDITTNLYQFSWHSAQIFASITTIVTYYFSKSMLLSTSLGMVVLTIINHSAINPLLLFN